MSSIFDAITAGDADAVGAALRADATAVATRNDQGVTPLRWALYQGKKELAALVLDATADDDLDVFDAASAGRVTRLAAILAADAAAVAARSGDGFTALHFAVFFDQPESAAVLLDAGADVAAVADNPMKVQPLHSAIAGRSRGGAVLLVRAGAPLGAAQEGGFTPLHEAAQIGDRPMVELLLARGVDATARLDDGRTAADIAAAAGHDAIATLLRG